MSAHFRPECVVVLFVHAAIRADNATSLSILLRAHTDLRVGHCDAHRAAWRQKRIGSLLGSCLAYDVVDELDGLVADDILDRRRQFRVGDVLIIDNMRRTGGLAVSLVMLRCGRDERAEARELQ